jgi:hypothetical protein
MDQAPGLAAADSGPKQTKAPKRAAADAMSPGHLASTTALAPAERRLQHAHLGVDKDFRDNVKNAESTLDLTKDVRELQQVMRQVILAVGALEKNDFDQEARMVMSLQRVEGIHPKLAALDSEDAKMKDALRDFERTSPVRISFSSEPWPRKRPS